MAMNIDGRSMRWPAQAPVMAPALLEQIVSDYVVGSGIDPSVLLHVNQTGCTYSPKL